MQASLYGQIVRWFQNHACNDDSSKKAKKKERIVENETPTEDDDEAVQSHLKELEKEVKKKNMDSDKVTRLLSLTFVSRREGMLSQKISTAFANISRAVSCIEQNLQDAEESQPLSDSDETQYCDF